MGHARDTLCCVHPLRLVWAQYIIPANCNQCESNTLLGPWSHIQGCKEVKGIQVFTSVSPKCQRETDNTEKPAFFNVLAFSLSLFPCSTTNYSFLRCHSSPNKPLEMLSLQPGHHYSCPSLLPAILPELVDSLSNRHTVSFKILTTFSMLWALKTHTE